jgi:hypothetical protein
MKVERVNQALSVLLDHEPGSEEYQVAAFAISSAIDDTHWNMLVQLVQDGPVCDGDVVTKGAQDDLIAWGLATKVCVRGTAGYTGANCLGLAVFQAG